MCVKMIINDQEVLFEPGKTIIEVARENHIYIPSLCYHPKTGALGKCRVCAVEVQGKSGLQMACTTLAAENMVVNTESDEIRAARKMVVNLLLANGQHNCLSCEANGECELQDAAYYLGIEIPEYAIDAPVPDMDASSEMIALDLRKCIQCGRCIQADNCIVVQDVLGFAYRSLATKVICDHNIPMGESSCVQCGECSQICPVGAILDKKSLGKGRCYELKQVETICPYCGVGCQITVHINERTNEIVKITGVEGSPTNDGMLCVKGRYGYEFVNSPERLTTPLIRNTDGVLREATWDDALKLIAETFTRIKQEHGADALAGLCSAKVTNEENFAFQKFMRREIVTNNIDHCARLCHSSTVTGLAASFGSGAMTNDIAGIKHADVILIIGSDTTAAHPVIANRIKQAIRLGKSKLIVIDPKEIEMAKFATIYARQRCGSDVAVLNGIMHEIIANDWHDHAYIAERCEGFDELKKAVEEFTPEKVEQLSGIPAAQLREIASLFGKADTASIFYAMGITQHTTGVDNVRSIANLQMLCGNIGKDGGGVNPLRGQSNVQGACDMGGLPNVFSGYQPVADEKANAKFSAAWQRELPKQPGLTLIEMLNAAVQGTLKALYIMGENPMISDPDLNHVEHALETLDFLVVQDIFLTETALLADVVLPAASYAEKDGTITNTERRVQRMRKTVKSPGQAKEDWEIIQEIANAMGADWKYQSAHDIAEEIRQLTPSYGGISWERLGANGLQWPCPTLEHPGTPYLHKGTFARGKGVMVGIAFKEPAELPDAEYPLVLTTGRVLQHFHTGTMTRKTAGLNKLAGPMVMISVEDAEELGICNNERIRVSSRRGSIEAPAFVTRQIGKGTVYIPFHYHEAAANVLTNAALDPTAKIPEYKACAVRVSKI